MTDPTIHQVAHRNGLLILRQRLSDLIDATEAFARLRESNHLAVNAVRDARGAVAAQNVADAFGHDTELARSICAQLSGTALGRLIMQGREHYSPYRY
ncbi:MAG: hypothetical protein ACLQO1_01680 [Steroidobacteraceae bacterium]